MVRSLAKGSGSGRNISLEKEVGFRVTAMGFVLQVSEHAACGSRPKIWAQGLVR